MKVREESPCCCGPPLTSPPSPGQSTASLLAATFRVEGLGCTCEGQIIEKRVKALDGVTVFSLNPITHQLKVIYNAAVVSRRDIEAEVKKAGMTPVFLKSEAPAELAGQRCPHATEGGQE